MKYEIELVEHPQYCVALIATLTGYEPDEIIAIVGNKPGGLRSKEFRHAFNTLGYSSNNKFIKFNKDTEFPSLLRARPIGKNKYKHWFALAYNDEKIYIPSHGIVSLEMFSHTLWGDDGEQMQITSMINIWV